MVQPGPTLGVSILYIRPIGSICNTNAESYLHTGWFRDLNKEFKQRFHHSLVVVCSMYNFNEFLFNLFEAWYYEVHCLDGSGVHGRSRWCRDALCPQVPLYTVCKSSVHMHTGRYIHKHLSNTSGHRSGTLQYEKLYNNSPSHIMSYPSQPLHQYLCISVASQLASA